MKKNDDPDRYADVNYRAKALVSAVFLGEPAATEMRTVLHTIDTLEERIQILTDMTTEGGGDGMHIRYALDALVADLDKWLDNDPDPSDAYDKLLMVFRELKVLSK